MPLSHEELKVLLVLNRLLLGGSKAVHSFLWAGHAPSEILSRIRSENFLQRAESLQKIESNFSAEAEIEKASRLGVRFLTLFDSDFPALLKHITDPPLVLYIKGSFTESDQAAVAMVGTRHPSLYGRTQARNFANQLAEKGMTIVSGLAQGIDQISHEAALEISYGRTVAVLGCGIDVDYPSGSKKLREKIIERGAIVSEYGFGCPPAAENFPRRNRIIAGLSRGVLVVEAHARSGSLITARLAMEEGRDVFAVPGPIDQLTSRGTNHLIKEGAALVEHADDIVEALALSIFTPMHPVLNDAELLPAPGPVGPVMHRTEDELSGLLTGEGLGYEEIAARSPLEPKCLFSLLTMLELQKKIQRTHDGRFRLIGAAS